MPRAAWWRWRWRTCAPTAPCCCWCTAARERWSGTSGAGWRVSADWGPAQAPVRALHPPTPTHTRPTPNYTHPGDRAERILCTALDEEGEASPPTAACWVGGRANCFALGYDDGSILVFGVPPAALQGALPGGLGAGQHDVGWGWGGGQAGCRSRPGPHAWCRLAVATTLQPTKARL